MIDGLDLDAMVVGLMSACFVTFWLQTVNDIPKAFSAVMFSALLSGVGSPVATVYLISQFPGLAKASETLPLLIAVLIGGSTTWGLPIFINFVQNKWGGSNA